MIRKCDSYVETLPEPVNENSLMIELRQNPAVCATLKRLREANKSAIDCGRDPWDFAVELSQFLDSGIGTHMLRVMISQNWITHMREVPGRSKYRREFEPESEMVLSKQSCFLITQKGLKIARQLTPQGPTSMTKNDSRIENGSVSKSNLAHLNSEADTQMDSAGYPIPCWDRKRRELRIGGVVVKKFKWPAENQEQVLEAFEEEGWPPRIDDPLIRHPKIDPKRRLHDTLKCLNRKQVHEYVKFRGDGTGRGVLLEINWNGDK